MSHFFIAGGAIAQLLLGSPVAPIAEVPQPVIVSQRLPKTVSGWLELGIQRYENRDYYGALSAFSEGIKIKPTVELLMMRSLAWSNVEEPKRALIDLNTAIAASKDNAKLYILRGYVYMRLQDKKNALADMNQAVLLQPNANAYLSRGITFLNFGDVEKGRTDLNIAAQYFKQERNTTKYNQTMELLGSI